MEPLFSIIIPAYNEEAWIGACLESVNKQEGGLNYEVIVADNNSTDRTAVIARELGARVVLAPERGVGRARKAGTEQAMGKYVLHIDADTRLPHNYLEQALSRFKKNPNLVCLGGQMIFYDAVLWQRIARPFFHYLLLALAVILSRGAIGPAGNNMTFRKKIYDQTVGFDAELKFGEDADLAIKLSKFGKVKLDMSLKCYISARRFKISRRLLTEFLNFLSICMHGRPFENELKHTSEL